MSPRDRTRHSVVEARRLARRTILARLSPRRAPRLLQAPRSTCVRFERPLAKCRRQAAAVPEARGHLRQADVAGEPDAATEPPQVLRGTINLTTPLRQRWDSREERQHLTTVVSSRR